MIFRIRSVPACSVLAAGALLLGGAGAVSVQSAAAARTGATVPGATDPPSCCGHHCEHCPPGRPGPPGPPGEPGRDGVLGWELVQEEFTNPPFSSTPRSVTCSAGKRVVSGGYTLPDTISPNASRPAGTNGWEVAPPSNYGFAYNFTVYAICALADPGV
ncbi:MULTISPECIES: hypothetical protein [unclassified Nonomuraea]|uniref:hypothetical protein n=1 Tax=Nonomuraea sp. NPDC047529 TaxID=3155623 RepID=UPI0033EF9B57